jgi:hypothetical protein
VKGFNLDLSIAVVYRYETHLSATMLSRHRHYIPDVKDLLLDPMYLPYVEIPGNAPGP